MPNHLKYSLKVGQEGAPRLKLLNKMCNPTSLQFIENNIQLKNKRILDLGCGIGILSVELAKRCLPRGAVFAVDISQDQLEIARSIAENNLTKNIRFRQISAFDIDQLETQFDLIYCRLLLAHLASVAEVISKIKKLMHCDSIIICEEPNSIDSLYCIPSDPIFDRFKQAAYKQVEVSHANFSIGRNLHTLFAQNNLKVIHKSITQAELNTPELKQQLWQGVIEISSLLITSGFATQDEINELVFSLKDFANHSKARVGYLECTQISAKLDHSSEYLLKSRL